MSDKFEWELPDEENEWPLSERRDMVRITWLTIWAFVWAILSMHEDASNVENMKTMALWILWGAKLGHDALVFLLYFLADAWKYDWNKASTRDTSWRGNVTQVYHAHFENPTWETQPVWDLVSFEKMIERDIGIGSTYTPSNAERELFFQNRAKPFYQTDIPSKVSSGQFNMVTGVVETAFLIYGLKLFQDSAIARDSGDIGTALFDWALGWWFTLPFFAMVLRGFSHVSWKGNKITQAIERTAEDIANPENLITSKIRNYLSAEKDSYLASEASAGEERAHLISHWGPAHSGRQTALSLSSDERISFLKRWKWLVERVFINEENRHFLWTVPKYKYVWGNAETRGVLRCIELVEIPSLKALFENVKE